MSDAHMHGRKFGLMLCEMLGVDPAHASRIVLESDPGKAAVAHVTFFLTNDQGERIAETVVRDFEIKERE